MTIGGTPYAFSGWSDGGARTHDDHGPRTTATLHGDVRAATRRRRIAGTDVDRHQPSATPTPGRAEVYRTTASATARVTAIALRLYVADARTATALVLGLYADSGGAADDAARERAAQHAGGRRLERGHDQQRPDARRPGRAYWIGLLNPADGDRRAALARPRRRHAAAPSRTSAEPQRWPTLPAHMGDRRDAGATARCRPT